MRKREFENVATLPFILNLLKKAGVERYEPALPIYLFDYATSILGEKFFLSKSDF
jgi:hypothetical protein